ncbi:alpha/beta-hydrolase [Stereum hirsutum FP-91666 SS1]|uniref:alpha/beta-hydrolase n=1 Tax=Stereum hirsutum (strain FP-91666) TaxID=721885 RepID=UPI000440CFB1|nr:alpha/beta-hydrolase [Stereum hirsutum FP-91666 SS1]EIM87275.1 alpha/beta-hydrolase [Stereum hirsutum FP-91666 SS1]
MHKETFEPMLSHLLSQAQSTSAYQIDEIWTWDAVQHGDSAQINASKLRAIFDWADNTRDILNFFINYLPEDSAPGSLNLPVHLERVSESISQLRTKQGFADRKIICVGHSFGGASLVLGAYNHPFLFSGLVLVDPVIIPRDYDRSEDLQVYLSGALGRRQEWASREEARRLLNAPFFARWDPAVLDSYVEHGMYSTPNGSVRLKTTGVQEAVVFAESLVTHEAWAVLDKLDEKIALKWIMPGEGGIGTEQLAQERVWLRPRNASNVRIAGAGHLAVQEKPREVAEEIYAFLEGSQSGTAQPEVCAGRTKAYL